MGGLMSITGERDGQPGRRTAEVGIAITDVLTGMYASVAICAALTHRERTGEGQYIDCALLDTIVAFNANQIVSYFCSGRIPIRYGNATAQVVPYEVFPTADGHIILAIGNDGQFQRFCEVAGCAELPRSPVQDQHAAHRAPRRADPADRRGHAHALQAGMDRDARGSDRSLAAPSTT
jgi:crotonobetainyl-CoA:carnitine CoA-transferase CaiB-like acyl-CoA transferase